MERDLHRQVCDYLRLQYPKAIFNSDGAGTNVSRTAAGLAKMLRSGRGYPDLFIAEPRGKYHGLFVELKREGTRIFLRSGELTTVEHVREQAAVLDALKERGYQAVFGIGFDDTRRIIDEYMKSLQHKLGDPMSQMNDAFERATLPYLYETARGGRLNGS